jgi:hypothetical protein
MFDLMPDLVRYTDPQLAEVGQHGRILQKRQRILKVNSPTVRCVRFERFLEVNSVFSLLCVKGCMA